MREHHCDGFIGEAAGGVGSADKYLNVRAAAVPAAPVRERGAHSRVGKAQLAVLAVQGGLSSELWAMAAVHELSGA